MDGKEGTDGTGAGPAAAGDAWGEYEEMLAAGEPHRPSPSLDPDAPASLGVGPLLATVVAIPLSALAWIFGAASAMACDSCDGAEAAAFDHSFTDGFHALQGMLWAAMAALAVSWVLPRRERFRTGRALLALCAPALVIAGYLVFAGSVDWPSGFSMW